MSRHRKATYCVPQTYARVRDLMPWDSRYSDPDYALNIKIAGHTIEHKTGIELHSYDFKYVFKPSSTNEQCFKVIAMPMIQNVLKGNNAILIAYGQPDSGKTYSIIGKQKLNNIWLCNAYIRIHSNSNNYITFSIIYLIAQYFTENVSPPNNTNEIKKYLGFSGILPQMLQFIINLKSVKHVELSGIEVFGHNVERIHLFDLFDETNQTKDWSLKKGIATLERTKTKHVNIANIQDINDKIIYAQSSCHFAPIGRNPKSSRGHICFITKIYQETQISHFIMVDCGGAEGKTAFNPEFVAKVTPQTLLCRRLEAGTIHFGLSQLLKIFQELRTRGKLTKNIGNGLRNVLHPYINTNTCLSLLFTLSPSISDSQTTKSILMFGIHAGLIKLKPIFTKGKMYSMVKGLVQTLRDIMEQQGQRIAANQYKIAAICRQQNYAQVAIDKATKSNRKIQKTRRVKIRREVVNDDGEMEYIEDYEEQIYYIDENKQNQSEENNDESTIKMDELLNKLPDDVKQLVASQKFISDEHETEILNIILEEENEESMKLVLGQYNKLIIPWKKEAFIKKKKAQITKRKNKSKDDVNLIDSAQSENDFIVLHERQKDLIKKLADPSYMPQREEMSEHAMDLQIMLFNEEFITEALKQSKQILIDHIKIKNDGREALITFFKMKSFSGGSSYSSSYRNTIGLSMGGAKDTNNFRKCIKQNIMPSINSITYNGLLSKYYFDTTTRKHCNNEEKNNEDDECMLFYPTYCYAKIKKMVFDKERNDEDINDNDMEYYMTVGLNSNIKQNEFKRKYLNLVILWDKSGSMNSTFDGVSNSVDIDINGKWRKTLKENDKILVNDGGSWYNAEVIEVGKDSGIVQIHYSGYPARYDQWIGDSSQRLAPFAVINTKMNSVKKAIGSILKQLTPKDRLGIVTFNNEADIVQRLQFVDGINMDNVSQTIESMTAFQGTNFEKGYKKSMEIYRELFNNDEYKMNSMNDEYDNRIIVLTDAQPNEGMSSSDELLKLIEKCAENKQEINGNDIENEYIHNRVYTTFIGVGLDFNSSLIESLSSTRGCNYYSVKSTKEFDDKMNEEFDNMVTPLVFNVCLKLKSEGNLCQIEKIYGSNDKKANDIISNGEIIKIHTLFPSKKSKEKGGTKGGIQLIKLKKTNNIDDNINVELEVSFEDRNGKKYKNIQNVTFNPPKQIHGNDMIENDEKDLEEMNINFYDNLGIRKAILLCKYVELIKQWIENDANKGNNYSSSQLKMSEEYKKMFVRFILHFKKEIIQCNDDTLQQEVDLMQKLICFVALMGGVI